MTPQTCSRTLECAVFAMEAIDSSCYFAPRDTKMFRLQSNQAGRDDVVDDHFVVLDHDPVYHQPQDLLLRLERRIFEGTRHAHGELLQTPQQPDLLLPLRPLLPDLGEPPLEHPTVLLDPSPPFLELREVDHLRLGFASMSLPTSRSSALSFLPMRSFSRSSSPSTAGSPRPSS